MKFFLRFLRLLLFGFRIAKLPDGGEFPNGEVYGADSLKSWVSRNWFGVVGSGDFAHYLAGTRVERLRTIKGAFAYAGTGMPTINEKRPLTYLYKKKDMWGPSPGGAVAELRCERSMIDKVADRVMLEKSIYDRDGHYVVMISARSIKKAKENKTKRGKWTDSGEE